MKILQTSRQFANIVEMFRNTETWKNESLRTIMHQQLHNLFDYDWNYVKLQKSSREYRQSSEE